MIHRMRGLLWIVALAACAKQGGVQIAVTQNGTAAKTVELYVGAGQPTDGATIVVDPTDPHTGSYWARDPSVSPATADVEGDHADFFIEPSGGPTQLPIVIVVGYDETGAVGAGEWLAVDVPDRGFLTYEIPLTSGERLLTWDDQHPTTAKGNRCVAAGNQGQEHMIVSPNDQDCDALTDGLKEECQPLVYKATTARPAVPDEFTCFGPSSSATPPVQCFVGGPQCMDGMGPVPPGSVCPLSHYCVPGPVCSACTSLECLASQLTFTVPHYDCVISTENTSQGVKVCEDPVMLPAGAGKDCTNVRLRNPQQNFLPTLAIDAGRTLRFAARSNRCKITISPSGSIPTTGTNQPDLSGITSLMAVDSVATPFTGFVVPVEFTFGDPADGCGNSACQINGNIGGTDRTAVCTTN